MKKKGSRFFQPETILELTEIIERESDITLLAGGTSIYRDISDNNLTVPGAIIILDKIPDLKRQNRTERYFEFGAMITIEEILSSSKKNLPKVLLKGLSSIAPYPVRNVATIGGTIADKNIISDIIPLLLIFNCKVEIKTFNNKKKKPKWESITQYLSTKESIGLHLITRVRIPLINPTFYQYYKTGSSFNLFNEISFSAIAEIEKSNISSLSMAFNIENRFIVKTKDIEDSLIGQRVPISHRSSESLIIFIENSLSSYKELKDYQKYQMTQIILSFLEGF